MADFTAKDVKALRDATGAGMMDAKRALEANDGDIEVAGKWLREQGIIKSAARTDRVNSQGAVAIAVDGRAAALVELKSETDFVAKSEGFLNVANDLAVAVLAEGEGAIESHRDAVDDLKVTLKENIELGKVVRIETPAGNVLDAYLHNQDGRGVNGVLVELAGGTREQAHGLALHIAFAKPKYLTRDQVPAAAIDAERASFENQTRNEGKPEQAVSKIVEGRLNAWIADQVLLEQKMIPDEKQSVQAALGDATVVRFAQAVIGA
ncbi:MAG: translation elongation factor Ts [Acidimicrobiales bacterium]